MMELILLPVHSLAWTKPLPIIQSHPDHQVPVDLVEADDLAEVVADEDEDEVDNLLVSSLDFIIILQWVYHRFKNNTILKGSLLF